MPQLYVRSCMRRYNKPLGYAPGTGGELARHLLNRHAIHTTTVVEDQRGDFYDPSSRRLHLQPQHFNGTSLTAITVAAHEFGHALQHYQGSALLRLRTSLGKIAAWLTPIAPLAFSAGAILMVSFQRLALALFALAIGSRLIGIVIHLITLPVELDASFAKALPILIKGEYIEPQDYQGARKILRAAALTYLSAALMQLLVVWRWTVLRR